MKSFVNSLTIPQVRAWACQHSNVSWQYGDVRTLRAFLIKSETTRKHYRKLYG